MIFKGVYERFSVVFMVNFLWSLLMICGSVYDLFSGVFISDFLVIFSDVQMIFWYRLW